MASVFLADSDQKPHSRFSLFRDERLIQILIQILFIAIMVGVCFFLFHNLETAWKRQGASFGFQFLFQRAGFDTTQSFIDAMSHVTNLQVLEAGLLNTIFVAIIGNVLSTILGIIVGVARISKNFLINRLAYLFIEILRNIPLLLIIIASYYVIIYSLPKVDAALALPGSIFISNRGLNLPRPVPGPYSTSYLISLVLGLAVIAGIGRYLHKRMNWDGFRVSLAGVLIGFAVATILWYLFPHAPFTTDIPAKTSFNFTGGMGVGPELTALLVGLVLGTSPFIADIVRAGIEHVSKDQLEAAQALGLSGYQTFRLVIFPQALRVIVPPLTSNYLSLTKNSSLAAAIAYPEIFGLSGTIINMTGRAVEVMLLVMMVYLTLSLLTALFMNWYNSKIRLVER